jgi:hypothetical protein
VVGGLWRMCGLVCRSRAVVILLTWLPRTAWLFSHSPLAAPSQIALRSHSLAGLLKETKGWRNPSGAPVKAFARAYDSAVKRQHSKTSKIVDGYTEYGTSVGRYVAAGWGG